MSIERKEHQENLKVDVNSLLNKLSSDIWEKLWLNINEIKEIRKLLTKFEQQKELASLKYEITDLIKSSDKITQSDIDELLLKAKHIVEQESKNERIVLQWELWDKTTIEHFSNTIESILPKSLVYSAKNPTKLHHNVLWISLWVSNTLISWTETIFGIAKWITILPYHLYLIISWKWEYNWFKNI